QEALYGRKIAATEIREEPLFIIGHWRSGTTLLHELLVQDPRHTFPTTYACFAPNHFVLTGRALPPVLNAIMPMQRPVDNMPVGWDRPQEDEFALCNMGLPSPYLSMAFPNEPPHDPEYLTFDGVSRAKLDEWKRRFLWFLKCVTIERPGRIILKSPPHTGRVRALLELFPKARFVHIVRDPIVLFASTMNLWKRLYRDQGLQTPHYRDLEDRVFDTLCRMYEAFERDRHLIPASQFCEVRYEQLVADPVGEMRRVYDELNLGEFDKALPGIEKYVASQADYQRNRYDIAPETRERIARRWAAFLTRYGYSPSAAG
ncbi:MAG: sulfotransferase, partial [Thermoguttaceae bacterium]|nr:sulfotransferase [Thermoguttaceae bacterium]